MQNKIVCNTKVTYESYILRRVKKSLNKLPLWGKIMFAKDFQKWIDNNGEKYTISRLKDIKMITINAYCAYQSTGVVPVIEQKGLTSFIKTDNSGRYFHGYLGVMQYRAIRSSKVLEQFIQLLHAYTLIVDDGVTKEDVENLLQVIEPRPQPEVEDYIQQFCKNVNGSRMLKYIHSHLKSYTTVRGLYNSKGKYVELEEEFDKSYLLKRPIGLPSSYSLQQPTEDHENGNFYSNVVSFNRSQLGYEIYQIMPGLWSKLPQWGEPRSTFAVEPVGRMNLLNEGGQKKRWVENTGYVYQWIAQPFGKRLYSLVRFVPWDCTFDESKGINTIQMALREGKTCHSVDIQKATDKIPMDYNVAILKKLLKLCPDANEHIEVFNKISRANVLLPEVEGIKTLYTRWATGQPMGSYPSFAMLTLVHGLILFILNGYKWDNDFIVHGDDVVIMNDSLAEEYKEFLKNSGIDYSPMKTITSDKIAEINSKIVLSDRVLSPVKWKEINIKNCLDVAPFWSTELVSAICGHVKKKVYKGKTKEVAYIKQVTTPQMVEDILALPYPWGANLNPKGLSLGTRFDKFPGLIESIFDPPKPNDYYCSHRDLVFERYSLYGTHTNSEGHKEIDHLTYQALLGELSDADQADRLAVLENTGIQVLPENYVSVRQINLTYLSMTDNKVVNKPSKKKTKSSSKDRKHELKLRFNKACSFYVPLVKC